MCVFDILPFKLNFTKSKKRKDLNTIFTSINLFIGKTLRIYFRNPQFEMAGIAFKG